MAVATLFFTSGEPSARRAGVQPLTCCGPWTITTVVRIDLVGNDLELSNQNLLIDGPADAFAIFRIPDDGNFKVSQSNIVVGNSGIGLNNVLFYTNKPDNNQHINVSDAIVNGVAFWDLGMKGGEITLNNVQGCTQVVADKINSNNVRLNNCAAVFAPQGTLSGHIYEDLNGNGIQEIGEPGLSGVDVVITDSQGAEQTVTTDANGDYSATLAAGDATVDVDDATLPVGSSQSEGTDPTTVTVPAGGTGRDIDGYEPD